MADRQDRMKKYLSTREAGPSADDPSVTSPLRPPKEEPEVGPALKKPRPSCGDPSHQALEERLITCLAAHEQDRCTLDKAKRDLAASKSKCTELVRDQKVMGNRLKQLQSKVKELEAEAGHRILAMDGVLTDNRALTEKLNRVEAELVKTQRQNDYELNQSYDDGLEEGAEKFKDKFESDGVREFLKSEQLDSLLLSRALDDQADGLLKALDYLKREGVLGADFDADLYELNHRDLPLLRDSRVPDTKAVLIDRPEFARLIEEYQDAGAAGSSSSDE